MRHHIETHGPTEHSDLVDIANAVRGGRGQRNGPFVNYPIERGWLEPA